MTTKRFIEMHATLQLNDDSYLMYKREYFEEHCLLFINQICSVFHGRNAYALLGNKIAIYSLNNIDEQAGVPSNAYFKFLLPQLGIDEDSEHYIRIAKIAWQSIPITADESYFEVI